MTIAPLSSLRGLSGTLLPRVPHVEVSRENVGSRLLIVGDVHGCATEFHSLVQRVSQSIGFMPTIISVGDLVNKGPLSNEVVSFARENNILCVRGNHEDDLLEANDRVGRFKDGLDGYRHTTLSEVTKDDIEWLRECPLSISFPWLKLLVVHAGIVPGVNIEDQSMHDLLWMRDLVEEDGRWIALETSVEGSKPWASLWDGPELVVFGHDAKRGLQLYPNAVGLDTGCCYGRTLSGLLVNADDITDRAIVSVPATKMYVEPKDKTEEPHTSKSPLDQPKPSHLDVDVSLAEPCD